MLLKLYFSCMRKIFYLVLGIVLVLQFFRPTRNTGEAHGPNDITHVVQVPEEVIDILKKSCYDCHSNNTHYPWYTNIQPIGWWLQDHVDEGKEELNFTEFKKYSLKKQKHKLQECEEMVEEDEMPLSSYTWMHSDAQLSNEEKQVLVQWVKVAMAELDEPTSTLAE